MNKKISTPVAIIVILVCAVLVGGVAIWQYWRILIIVEPSEIKTLPEMVRLEECESMTKTWEPYEVPEEHLNVCYAKVAMSQQNSAICDKIRNSLYENWCIKKIKAQTLTPEEVVFGFTYSYLYGGSSYFEESNDITNRYKQKIKKAGAAFFIASEPDEGINIGKTTIIGDNASLILTLKYSVSGDYSSRVELILINNQWKIDDILFLREDQIADWKTYKNEKYGFEFKYPQEMSMGSFGPPPPDLMLLALERLPLSSSYPYEVVKDFSFVAEENVSAFADDKPSPFCDINLYTKKEPYNFNGINFYKRITHEDSFGDTWEAHKEEYFTTKNGICFNMKIRIASPAENIDLWSNNSTKLKQEFEVLKKMISTFRFLE